MPKGILLFTAKLVPGEATTLRTFKKGGVLCADCEYCFYRAQQGQDLLLRLDKGLNLPRSLRFVSLHFCPGLIAYNDYNTNKDGKASPGAHGVYLTNGGF